MSNQFGMLERAFEEAILFTADGLLCRYEQSDGGPDENCRHDKVIAAKIRHFKKYDLDFFVQVMPAPGDSAYNQAERRYVRTTPRL